MKAFQADQRDLRRDHDELASRLPNVYARRDDVKDGFQSLEKRIEEHYRSTNEKLDRLLLKL